MKLGEIQKIYMELTNVNDGKLSILDKRLPMKVGFVVNRNLNKMQPIIEDLDKVKREAVEKYALRDDDGNMVEVEGGGISIADAASFSEAIADVLDSDIEFEFDKFKMEDLEKCESDGYDKLTVAEQGALEAMIS